MSSLHSGHVGGQVACIEAVQQAASMPVGVQGRRMGGSDRVAEGAARSEAAPHLQVGPVAQGLRTAPVLRRAPSDRLASRLRRPRLQPVTAPVCAHWR